MHEGEAFEATPVDVFAFGLRATAARTGGVDLPGLMLDDDAVNHFVGRCDRLKVRDRTAWPRLYLVTRHERRLSR